MYSFFFSFVVLPSFISKGVLYSGNATIFINFCTFSHCSADYTGGAMFFFMDNPRQRYLSNLNFYDNVAGQGYGNDITDASPSSIFFYNATTVKNCTSNSSSIQFYGTNLSLDCLFNNNSCIYNEFYVSKEGTNSQYCFRSELPCLTLVCLDLSLLFDCLS
jgi:hypothetical protein